MKPMNLACVAAVLVGALAGPAKAELIGGVEFPQGTISFADSVVDYSPGVVSSGPTDPYRGAFNALEAPDYAGANTCATAQTCSFVSLGVGGTLTLRFTDNLLTGSGSAADDLWIFEIGPDVEDTLVWISKDGQVWSPVGSVTGSTRGIDIDSFGFGVADQFGWVRLQDVANLDGTSGATVGADIDAVGAISTVRVSDPPTGNGVPLPGTLALMGMGMLTVALRRSFGRS